MFKYLQEPLCLCFFKSILSSNHDDIYFFNFKCIHVTQFLIAPYCPQANFQTLFHSRFLLFYEVLILIILMPHSTLSQYWVTFRSLSVSCSLGLWVFSPLLFSRSIFFPFPLSGLLCWPTNFFKSKFHVTAGKHS